MKKGYKECPFCGEEIKEKAVKCLHCKEFLDKKKIEKVKIEEKKEVEQIKDEELNIENDNIFSKIFVQLFASIIFRILRILGFIISPLSIPNQPDELGFIGDKYFDKEPKYRHYLLFTYMIIVCTISFSLFIQLIVVIVDGDIELDEFLIGLGVFYGIHLFGYIICLLLCKYKYKDEYLEYVKNYDKKNKK